MLVRFIRVIRVSVCPVCANAPRGVSLVCPGSPRCLFTGTLAGGDFWTLSVNLCVGVYCE